MKVKKSPTTTKVTFADLSVGDTYEDEFGVFMKVKKDGEITSVCLSVSEDDTTFKVGDVQREDDDYVVQKKTYELVEA